MIARIEPSRTSAQGLAPRFGRMAPEVEPLAGDQAVWIDVGVERLQCSNGQSRLARNLGVRISGSHQPVRTHVPQPRLGRRRRPMPTRRAGRMQDHEHHGGRHGRKHHWSEKAPKSAPPWGSWRVRDHRCGTANVFLTFDYKCGASAEALLAPRECARPAASIGQMPLGVPKRCELPLERRLGGKALAG